MYLDGIFEYWQYIWKRYIWMGYLNIWKRCISILAVYIWIFGWDILILAGAEHGSSRGPGNYQAEQGLDDNCMHIVAIIITIIIFIIVIIIINTNIILIKFTKLIMINISS